MRDFFDSCAEFQLCASVELDEELSEFDAARLQAHLRACPACSLWADRAGTLAGLLREAELELPTPIDWTPARGVNIRRTGAVAGAAASIAAVALAVIAVTFPSAGRRAGTESRAEVSVLPGSTCSACDVARAFVSANFASSTASFVPQKRRHPGPI